MTSNRLDLKGKVFGKLKVVKPVGNKGGYVLWLCNCSCGKTLEVRSSYLKSGNTKSCGCLRTKHSMSATRTYDIWKTIKVKCTKKDSPTYKKFGGKGIKLDDKWYEFANFYKGMGKCPKGHTLDRIDDAGDFTLTNCHWVKLTDDRVDTTRRMYKYKGKIKNISEWARDIGITKQALWLRLKKPDADFKTIMREGRKA